MWFHSNMKAKVILSGLSGLQLSVRVNPILNLPTSQIKTPTQFELQNSSSWGSLTELKTPQIQNCKLILTYFLIFLVKGDGNI